MVEARRLERRGSQDLSQFHREIVGLFHGQSVSPGSVLTCAHPSQIFNPPTRLNLSLNSEIKKRLGHDVIKLSAFGAIAQYCKDLIRDSGGKCGFTARERTHCASVSQCPLNQLQAVMLQAVDLDLFFAGMLARTKGASVACIPVVPIDGKLVPFRAQKAHSPVLALVLIQKLVALSRKRGLHHLLSDRPSSCRTVSAADSAIKVSPAHAVLVAFRAKKINQPVSAFVRAQHLVALSLEPLSRPLSSISRLCRASDFKTALPATVPFLKRSPSHRPFMPLRTAKGDRMEIPSIGTQHFISLSLKRFLNVRFRDFPDSSSPSNSAGLASLPLLEISIFREEFMPFRASSLHLYVSGLIWLKNCVTVLGIKRFNLCLGLFPQGFSPPLD